ncbi:signal peptidase I [Streptomyces sp. NBC_00335]|uniref:signal peptidase I n=1 Tax=unclassified Streptomyces TaxID=2593676 RepID=UPI0022590173|nr:MULTISPECIES: signal peptidase I [unclassified Streptomyces]MCX5406876.1 signal peptidase I [Streptomyces sp. NBC_00086]
MVLGAALFVGAGSWTRFVLADEYQMTFLPSESMRPAYSLGDQVWFDRVAPGEVRHGDAVVFAAPASWVNGAGIQEGQQVFKRVVALGGDRISWAPGEASLTLNGKPLVEPYLMEAAVPATMAFDVTVPEGRMFLMGDHRSNSFDSHLRVRDEGQGTVPVSAVWGVALAEVPDAAAAAGLVGMFGVPVFLVGGGLGIGSLVARRRAAKAARNAAGAGPGQLTWAYEAASSD